MPPHRFPAPASQRGTSSPSGPDTPAAKAPQNSVAKQKKPHSRPRSEHGERAFGGAPTFPKQPPFQREDAPEEKPSLPAAHEEQNEGVLQPGIKPVIELLLTSPEKIDAVFLRKGRKDKDSDRILDLCREAGVRFSLVDDTFMDRLWPGRHQGAIARLFATGFLEFEDLLESAVDAPLPLIVALDQVQDPGNAGALARTLYALGGAGLVVPRHNGVYLGAAAARVSAGALDKLAVSKVTNLAQALDTALDAGYTVYGADAAAALAVSDPGVVSENVFSLAPRFPAILVLGSEDAGLRPIIRKRCSGFLSIPFAREFDSLNVAQAGAIIISAFAAMRQKTDCGRREK